MACNGNFAYMFIFVCFICMLYHISSISSKYFKYEASTRLQVKQPDTLAPPSFTFCVKYLDVSNISNHSTTTIGNANGLSYYRNVTLKQIFTFTPPSDKIITSCLLNYPGNYTVRKFFNQDCLKIFDISRYFTQGYICYTLTPSIGGKFKFRQVSKMDAYEGVAFFIGFNLGYFNNCYAFKGIVHSSGTLPVTSMQFSPQLVRPPPVVSNRYFLTYFQVYRKLLPAPYPDYCSENTPRYCYEECMISKTVRTWRHFPFSEIITDDNATEYNSGLPHLTGFDMLDETFSRRYSEAEEKCSYRCRHGECEYDFSVTQFTSSYAGNKDFAFRIELPKYVSYYMSLIPSMYFIDYITMVMSCFGTWLGVSALNFNPMKIWRWLSNRDHQVPHAGSTNPSNRLIPRVHLLLNGHRRETSQKMAQMQSQLNTLFIILTKNNMKSYRKDDM